MEDLRTQLEELNDEDLLSLFREANSWDGSFDFCDTYDIDDVAGMLEPRVLAAAIIYGDVTNNVDDVRFNVYGNLETVTSWELYGECRDNIDELADWLEDNADNIDLDCYGIEVA